MHGGCGSHQVPGRATSWSLGGHFGGRLALGCGQEELEPSPTIVSGSTAKFEICRPGSGSKVGMFPMRSLGGLDCSLTMIGGVAAAEYRALSGSPEVQVYVSPP